MSNCKNCNAPIELKQGRRPREFCDNNNYCKQQYYLKNKKAKETVTIPIGELTDGEIYSWIAGRLVKIDQKLEAVTHAKKAISEIKKDLNAIATSASTNPTRLSGESSLDYRIRCEELRAKK